MKKITQKFLSILIIVFVFSSFFVFDVNASVKEGFNNSLTNTAKESGYTPANDSTALFPMISLVIKIFLSLLGVIFLGLMIYGGFIWMIAKGNEQEVQKAKKVLQNSVIGLLIILAAYAITAIFQVIIK